MPVYHVDADYFPPRADMSPPHWVCGTHALAEMLVSHLNTTRRDLRNVRIRETGYC
jgi:hypothetical protein